MPGRHVRFSSANTFYSPHSELSSLPSSSPSSGQYTPLPVDQNYSYAVPFAPPRPAPRRAYTLASVPPARAHRLLRYTPSEILPLTYDLLLPPSTVTAAVPNLPSTALTEPATYPPQATLFITSAHLPWIVTVSASNGQWASIADVLRALHTSLRAGVTAAEFAALGSERHMRRAAEAYTRRYMRLKGHPGYAQEKAGGVRRIDFLMECTRFLGLESTTKEGAWRMHVV